MINASPDEIAADLEKLILEMRSGKCDEIKMVTQATVGTRSISEHIEETATLGKRIVIEVVYAKKS